MRGFRYRVLTTPRSFGKESPRPIELLEKVGIEVVETASPRPVSVENLEREIKGMDALIVGIDPVTAEVLAAADSLKVISKYGAGVDNIDLTAAKKRGIVVTNTPEANSHSVAELAMGVIFALARRIPYADRVTKLGKWERVSGIELLGKTLGIVGMGKVGRRLAKLALGVGMKVVAFDPYVTQDSIGLEEVRLLPFRELLSVSDFISIHLPLTEETQKMFNRETLHLVKKGSYLINTSRGEVLDEGALVEVLKSSRLAGAALDVYSHEPPANSPLLNLDNVITTPHIGAHTREAIERMGVGAAENVIAVLLGVGEPNVVS